MKTRIISLSATLLALFMTAPAWALYIDENGDGVAETDVGDVDTVEGFYAKPQGGQIDFPGTGFDGTDCSTYNGNSVDAELCWAEGVLGVDLSEAADVKSETVSFFQTYTDQIDPSTLNTADAIAVALNNGPGYYIIKNSTEYIILTNLANLDWGVIDLGDQALGGVDFDCSSDCTVSHVTEFNGTTVAEPGSLALLGAGLLALGGIRRRRPRI